MPPKQTPEPLPLPARVQSSFQQLSIAASALNTASDRLSKLVGQIDAALKPLNVGLECWVNIGIPLHSEDGEQEYREQVGYAKIGGKWGIALKTVDELIFRDDAHIEQWAFNDAPRQLRLKAIDYIQDLLAELSKEAAKFTEKIAQKTGEVQQLVSALKGGANQ
jgi:hypothetical protein